MKITKSQQNIFWRWVSQAASNLGRTTSQEREDYRRRVLREEAGVEHLADLGKGEPFEKVMMRLCEDAGDYQEASAWAIGGVKRYRHLIRERIREIFARKEALGIEQKSVWVDGYAASILMQGRLVITTCSQDELGQRLEHDLEWEDIPELCLRKLLQIVTTELRRLEKGVAA